MSAETPNQLDSIVVREPATETETEDLAHHELAQYNPTKRAAFFETAYIATLRRDARELRKHCTAKDAKLETTQADLADLRVDYGNLSYGRSWDIYLSSIWAVGTLIGSCLIDAYPDGSRGRMFGWASVVAAIVVAVGIAAIRRVASKAKPTKPSKPN